MHDPAAKNEIKLTQSGRHAGRHFHKAVERLHHDFGAATGQVMFCGKSRRLCRGILSYRVPLATIGTLSGPAGMLDAAIDRKSKRLKSSHECAYRMPAKARRNKQLYLECQHRE